MGIQIMTTLGFLSWLTLGNILIVLEIIVAVGMLIFVHELGHFIVAKLANVKVFAFAIGFGPKIFGFKIGETEYKLLAIPLGGFVKMAGEIPGDESSMNEPRSVDKKSPGWRAAIFSAGVIMNALFALFLFFAIHFVGEKTGAPVVAVVNEGTPAAEAGLEPGDEVVSYNGNEIKTWRQLNMEVALGPIDEPAGIIVERNGETLKKTVTPRRNPGMKLVASIGVAQSDYYISNVVQVCTKEVPLGEGNKVIRAGDREFDFSTHDEFNAYISEYGAAHPGQSEMPFEIETPKGEIQIITVELAWMIGIGLEVALNEKDEPYGIGVTYVMPDSAAEKADLEFKTNESAEEYTEDVITHFNDIALKLSEKETRDEDGTLLTGEGLSKAVFDKLTRLKDEVAGRPVPLKVVRSHTRMEEGKAKTTSEEITLELAPKAALPGMLIFGFRDKFHYRESFTGAVKMALHETGNTFKQVKILIVSIFSRKVGGKEVAENVGGPIKIIQISFFAARQGHFLLLYFLAMLSLNLAVINVLPIPILDGGHLMFLAIEKVKGSPVSDRFRMVCDYIGLFLILCLIVFTLVNDIANIL